MEHSTATLRAALESLGDWDDALDAILDAQSPLSPLVGGSVPSVDVTTSSPSSEKRSWDDERGRKTKYQLRRDSRKAAVIAFEAQVVELETALKKERERVNNAAQSRRANCGGLIEREWEEIAARQKRQRLAVEAEQVALQDLLVAQLSRARHVLKRTKKALAKLNEALGSGVTARLANYQGPHNGTAQHLRYLDYRMDEAGVVLSSGPFARCQQDFAEVSFRDHGEVGLQVEFTASWVLPFGVDAVANAIWRLLLHTGHDGRSTDYQLAHVSSDMVVTNFLSVPDPNGKPNCNHGQPIPGTSQGQTVVRRFPTTDSGSVFFVSRINAEIFNDNGKATGEMLGDGWIQVEPMHAMSSNTTPLVSRVRWCRRVKGRQLESHQIITSKRASWVHSVVTGPMRAYWEKSLARNVMDVENMLFAK